jgi:hypothetical protein
MVGLSGDHASQVMEKDEEEEEQQQLLLCSEGQENLMWVCCKYLLRGSS